MQKHGLETQYEQAIGQITWQDRGKLDHPVPSWIIPTEDLEQLEQQAAGSPLEVVVGSFLAKATPMTVFPGGEARGPTPSFAGSKQYRGDGLQNPRAG